MKVSIQDTDALRTISPSALDAYARSAGWEAGDSFRKHSTIFTGDNLPEVIIPRTARLGDYASVVSTLIKIFADIAEQSESAVFRILSEADRDVVRIRTSDRETDVTIQQGIDIVRGSKNLLLAAACSYFVPRKAVFRPGAHRDAVDFLSTVKLKPLEEGSFVVSLVSQAIAPDQKDGGLEGINHEPISRLVFRKLSQALEKTNDLTECINRQDEFKENDFISHGVSANFCEAIESILKVCEQLEIQVAWARNRPVEPQFVRYQFDESEVPLFGEAAKKFRRKTPKHDISLFGFVNILRRDELNEEGTINLQTRFEDQDLSVQVELEQMDYEQVVEAHRNKSAVEMSGDLEHRGARWRLLNASVTNVVTMPQMEPETDLFE
ncbi:MAG: hypothetical protein F4039_04980 [Gammaproteobacteria bacterium]|nr:hypothetical protein [Gammaproteobacteria bacterium]MYF53682.1 hypothetical protein [Gammaproteobacteria bacterium]MYK43423.1 hypothetical protein [Gammaproteobacteria bacterium]